MMPSQETLIPILVFVAVLLGVNASALLLAGRRSYRRRVSSRLGGSFQENQKELMGIRRARSLSSDGHYVIPVIPLNKLVLQSGVTVGLFGVIATMVCLFVAAYLLIFAFQKHHLVALAAACLTGIGLPLIVLKMMREQRQRRFEQQLPDAVDIMVRGLKAGHSIPVAIHTVSQQMPDPIGGEFALTAGELTYGLDLETAMVNMRSRVGQIDLALLVLAVSIQSKMGGNLAEILSNLARVIRGRFRLRRKAKALSSEGRFSAVALSVIPFALFAILWLIAPSFYGQVWNEPVVKPVLVGAIAWLLLGNVIMYRMVRFSV